MQVVERVCDKCKRPAHVLMFNSRGKNKHNHLVLCCNTQCPNNAILEFFISEGVKLAEGTGSN